MDKLKQIFNTNKKIFFIISGILLLLTICIGSFFIYKRINRIPKFSDPTELPSRIEKPFEIPPFDPLEAKTTFQKVLATYCREENRRLSDLPILIDEDRVDVEFLKEKKPICIGYTEVGKGLILIGKKAWDYVYILYDLESQDDAHGGPSRTEFEDIMTKIGEYNYEDIEIVAFLPYGELGIFAGPVLVKGRKELILDNDEIFWVTTSDKILIEEENPELSSILKKYSAPYQFVEGELRVTDYKMAVKEIREKILGDDLFKLGEDIKSRLDELKEILDAVEVKQ